MRILGVDPGPVTCGVCIVDCDCVQSSNPKSSMADAQWLAGQSFDCVAIEIPTPRGLPMPMSAIWTAVNAGMIASAGFGVRFYTPPSIRVHHCGRPGAKDPMVKQAIIDRFGGKEKAIGRKKSPGPLYGVMGHAWSALAVALMCADEIERGIDTSVRPDMETKHMTEKKARQGAV